MQPVERQSSNTLDPISTATVTRTAQTIRFFQHCAIGGWIYGFCMRMNHITSFYRTCWLPLHRNGSCGQTHPRNRTHFGSFLTLPTHDHAPCSLPRSSSNTVSRTPEPRKKLVTFSLC